MTTDVILTSKGQTAIPKEIRDSLGMKPGDRMPWPRISDHAARSAALELS